MQEFIRKEIALTTMVLDSVYHDDQLINTIIQISNHCTRSLSSGNKILFAGNGGSAADAQHLASELVGRLRLSRPGLAALSLTADTSVLTSIGNDYGFEELFAHQINALGQPNDVFIAITTSGRLPNILKALEVAQKKKLIVVGLTGSNSIKLDNYCDYLLKIPSADTQKIQECHIILGHILCGLIEQQMFKQIHAELTSEMDL